MTPAEATVPATVDAVVCGGGPAGATFAALLVRQGLSVAVFERERFPRFHIGESLLPWNMPLLERARRAARAEAQHAAEARRAVLPSWHRALAHRPLRRRHGRPPSQRVPGQARRFDRILLDNARRSGAAVFEEARVEEVLFDASGKRAPACA